VGTAGQIQYSDGAGHFVATDWTTAPGLISANNGTSNLIHFNNVGLGNPTFTTRSPGTKFTLWDGLGGAAVDYALGMASGTLWFSVPGSTAQFQWFAGTAIMMTLSGTGNLTLPGNISAGNSISSAGSNAILLFADRTGTSSWGWYATSNIARLWNTGTSDLLSVYPNGYVVMNNGTYLQAKDTTGAAQTICTFYTNNELYFSETNRSTHYRGGPVRLESNGPVQSNAIAVQGADGGDSLTVYKSDRNSFLTFKPETSANWAQIGYYRASAGVWGNIEFPGPVQCDSSFYVGGSVNVYDIYSRNNFNCAGNYYCAGQYLWLNSSGGQPVNGSGGPLVYGDGNYLILKPGSANIGVEMRNYGGARIFFADGGGNCSCPGSFTGGNVYSSGSFFIGGCQWWNNGGWWWTPNPIHTDSDFQANNITCNNYFYLAGLQVHNNSGWWWTTNSFHTDGDLQTNGSLYFGGNRLYNNSGYAYFDQVVHAAGLYSRGDIWNAGNINSGNQLNCPNACIAGSLQSHGTVGAAGDYQCNGGRYLCYSGGVINAFWSGSGAGDSVFYAGNGAMTASAFNAYSDERLKINIAASDIGLVCILGLVPKTFRRRATPDREELGLIAQEVQTVLPQAVKLIETNLGDEPRLAIDYAQITAALINAVKELAAEVASLKEARA
jgi:hypothetical protein